jgi:hypothetical protein
VGGCGGVVGGVVGAVSEFVADDRELLLEFVNDDWELLLLAEVSASDPVPPWLRWSQPAINAPAANKMNSFFI